MDVFNRYLKPQYLVPVFLLLLTVGLALGTQRLLDERAFNTAPQAQTADSLVGGGSGKSGAADRTAPPPEGVSEKVEVRFIWDSTTDTMTLRDVRGQLGFIKDENTDRSAPTFDIVSYGANNIELYRRAFKVLDEALVEEAASRPVNVLGATSDTYIAQRNIGSPAGLSGSSGSSVDSPSGLVGGTGGKNRLDPLSVVEYTAEVPYSQKIDRLEIVPSEDSDKKARLEISSSQINHSQIQSQINSTTFGSYSSQRILGASTIDDSFNPKVLGEGRKRIGILFISNNFVKENIGEFYTLVEEQKTKMLENAVIAGYRNNYEVNAVENYEDLGCKYWWPKTEGLETVLVCFTYRCDIEGKNCYWGEHEVTEDLMNTYRSDLAIIVHKTDDWSCRSTGGNPINFCTTNAVTGYAIEHEMGHALMDLHDEYTYAGDSSYWNVDSRNCTSDDSCSVWSHIPNEGCYQGCARPDMYRGTDGYLMQNPWVSNDFGPVASYYAFESLERFGPPEPTPMPCGSPCRFGEKHLCESNYCNVLTPDGSGVCANERCPNSPTCECIECGQVCHASEKSKCTSNYCNIRTPDGFGTCQNQRCPNSPTCECIECGETCNGSQNNMCTTNYCQVKTPNGFGTCENKSCPDSPNCQCN